MDKILIVDDTSSFRLPVAAFLRREGYETICATNGKEALDLARTQPPDIILLDVAMPVMDGLKCLASLREHNKLRNIPVIMLTALSEADVVMKAALDGVNSYLLKSQFSLNKLLTAIEQQLSLARSSMAKCGLNSSTAGKVGHEESKEKAVLSYSRDETLEKIHGFLSRESRPSLLIGACGITTESSFEDISNIVADDPAVVARLMKLANSGTQKHGTPARTLFEAVRRMGNRAAKQCLIKIGTAGYFSQDSSQTLNARRFFEHSLATAEIAEGLADELGVEDVGPIFIAGLLHDVGRSVLSRVFEKRYREIVQEAREQNVCLFELELRTFGISHTEVTKEVLNRWEFRQTIVEIAGSHDWKIGAYDELSHNKQGALIVSLANRLAHAFAAGDSGDTLLLDTAELTKALKLSPEIAAAIALDAVARTTEAGSFILDSEGVSSQPLANELMRNSAIARGFRVLAVDGASNPCALFLKQLRRFDAKSPLILLCARSTDELRKLILDVAAIEAAEGILTKILVVAPFQLPHNGQLSARASCQISFPVRYEFLIRQLESLSAE